jgi:HEAT repeat protein
MGAMEQASHIAALVADPDDDVRKAVAMSLGELRARGQSATLARLLKDSKPWIRSAAARALGQVRATDRQADLGALLNDTDGAIRSSAADALEMMGPLPASALPSIAATYYRDRSIEVEARFNSHYLTGGHPKARLKFRERR